MSYFDHRSDSPEVVAADLMRLAPWRRYERLALMRIPERDRVIAVLIRLVREVK